MEYFGQIKDSIRPLFVKSKQKTNHDRKFYDDEIQPGSRIWFFLLCLSSAVILLKYLSDYGISHALIYKSIRDMDISLVNSSIETFVKPLSHIWEFMCRFQWILTPSLFATGFTCFSWIVLYKDSDIPGVNPPTPFSPPRFRNRCSRSMDFSYALTGTFGLLIFIRLLYQSLRDLD